MTVSVLLPTLNEETNIIHTIKEVRQVLPNAEIVVIDGLSTDKTVELAKSMGVKILLEKRNGKGFAIKKAFEEVESDHILMIDADLTYPVKDMPKFLKALEKYDVVMGSRFKGHFEDGSMPLVNGFGNRVICVVASVLYLKPVSDVCTGMWGFRKKAYKSMKISAHTFELECNMFAQAVKKGFNISEIPITYSRRGGESKVRLIDGVKDCVLLLRERFTD
ncbi:MAG: glycosyltransferase family 2 protein [Candidatus Micrarchaeota archaeon]